MYGNHHIRYEPQTMIKIYSTPLCPYCQTLKEYLAKHKIDFIDIDVSTNEEERNKMIKLSDQMGVPVLDINGKIIVGFDKAEIDKTLGLKRSSKS